MSVPHSGSVNNRLLPLMGYEWIDFYPCGCSSRSSMRAASRPRRARWAWHQRLSRGWCQSHGYPSARHPRRRRYQQPAHRSSRAPSEGRLSHQSAGPLDHRTPDARGGNSEPQVPAVSNACVHGPPHRTLAADGARPGHRFAAAVAVRPAFSRTAWRECFFNARAASRGYCGAQNFKRGPAGTIRVGLMWGWLM